MARSWEIAGISVPFTAGVAAGALLTGHAGLTCAEAGTAAVVCLAAEAALFVRLALSGGLDTGRRAETRSGRGAGRAKAASSSSAGKAPSESRTGWLLAAMFAVAGIYCHLAACLRGAPAPDGLITRTALRCASRLRSLIDSMPFAHEQSTALVKALLTGERSSLSRATVLAFRASGASHLLALSGLHLGFIYIIIRRMARLVPWRGPAAARVRAAAVIALCGFYVLMTGEGPSIVRAFIYICIREISGISPERRSDPGRTLLCALTIQLALTPEALESIGFQLSYLAMAGITFIMPVMQAWYPPSCGPLRKIWDVSALSISCQLLTAPAAWLRFGTFPKYFLLTNLLAMPLCSATMGLSIAAIALYAAGLCPAWLIRADDSCVQLFIRVLDIISRM